MYAYLLIVLYLNRNKTENTVYSTVYSIPHVTFKNHANTAPTNCVMVYSTSHSHVKSSINK